MHAEPKSNHNAVRNLADDWTPERETALLLDLCEAQLEAAVRDSDQSVDSLVRAFTDLADASRSITELAKQLTVQQSSTANATELNHCAQDISQLINNAVVAFQFYDKLAQRLGHVRHSLTTLALFVCDRTQAQQRGHWEKLLTSLRRLYRTQEERAVFDLVSEGAKAETVRAAVVGDTLHTASGGIELF